MQFTFASLSSSNPVWQPFPIPNTAYHIVQGLPLSFPLFKPNSDSFNHTLHLSKLLQGLPSITVGTTILSYNSLHRKTYTLDIAHFLHCTKVFQSLTRLRTYIPTEANDQSLQVQTSLIFLFISTQSLPTTII